MLTKLFPFEYVQKRSRVIIYGLGAYGRSYIQQIEMTDWCEIVGVSDANSLTRAWKYPFYSIHDLCNVRSDYIIIAIKAIEVVSQVHRQLVECGIPESKIITTLGRIHQNYRHVEKKLEKDDKLRILLKAKGGLGDCIVYLSVYEKISGMLLNADIDIQCRKAYGQALYMKKRLIHSIIDENSEFDTTSYDLILELAHGIKVVKYDKLQCYNYSADLGQKIEQLLEAFDDVDTESQYYYAVQIRKACIKRWDRYRALGHGEVLDLSANMVKIDLSDEYFSEYKKLNLKKFITINFGADTIGGRNKQQTKVWPRKYYERLIPMLKAEYPEYEIVQLGSNDAEQVQGTDRCIRGQSLELVKHILKKSMLHFDCEGGLVHLATALGTKCAVVFGPTPIEYYGYSQNINITAGKCHNCMSLTSNWYYECIRGEEERECMYGITPEKVFKKICSYLDNISLD